ncbi:MAG: DNA repair protein RadA [Spirochaetales bacterium]|nr:DNA repair protein RadA [Spirochaetales bacterium]
MKSKLYYICSQCGHNEPKWLGRCPECGNWNTLQEREAVSKTALKKAKKDLYTVPLSSLEKKQDLRFDAGIAEMNRVLGGGIMKGSSILIGGEPGIGKTTLMLQLACSIKSKGRVLYISGEESPAQLKMHADRIGIGTPSIEVFSETEMSAINTILDQVNPVLIIIDSIQTMINHELGLVAGTVNQIKYCSQELIEWVKSKAAVLFLIGHVTKEGTIAGPKVIEHMVDTVLSFESADNDLRFLRTNKNRFGPSDEIGIFRMTETGLAQIDNAATLFLEQRAGEIPPGIVIAPIYEGSRILLVELQCLVVPAKGGISRVLSDRIDARVVSKAAAVLEKHLNIQLTNYDVYVNVAGGLQLKEVGVELPLCLALYSARLNIPLSHKTAICGEVSLAGEIRPIKQLDKRIKTAYELGFTHLYGPLTKESLSAKNINYNGCSTLQQAVKSIFDEK